MKKRAILFMVSMLLFACFTIGIAQDDLILDTKYYPPSGEPGNIAIMFLGGSDGGFPNKNVEPFTAKGYPCFKVGYFGTKNTPDRLELIPLEYFEEAIKMFKSYPEVRDKKIVLYGGSKGGELVLLLASRYKLIEGVIAKVPSSVVFQGIGGPSSSWSYKGQPVPYVPYYEPFDYRKVVNNQWVELYKLSLTQTKAVEKAAINVENINGPILILTGKEDTVWPSSQMGEMIIKRLKENNFPHWYKHVAYEDAGHSFDGNKKARIDSEQRIFAFLSRLSEKKYE